MESKANVPTEGNNGKGRNSIPIPEYSTVDELNDLIEQRQIETGDEKHRQVTKGGFKSVGGLKGLDPAALCLMAAEAIAAACMHPEGESALKIFNSWLKTAPAKLKEQSKRLRNLAAYQQIAEDFKIKQIEGESATEFITRVQAAMPK